MLRMVTRIVLAARVRSPRHIVAAVCVFAFCVLANPAYADDDASRQHIETALRNAVSGSSTETASRSFEQAVNKRRDTTLPDTRGLLDWLKSQPTATTDIDALLRDAEQLHSLSVNEAGYDGQVYVFVSFSMPELALRNLYRAAAPKGIPLVLRGFVTDEGGTSTGLMATRDRLIEVFGDDLETGAGVLIDPTLFERFEISQVPAFVATANTPIRCDESGCDTPDNWQLFGDVTLAFALERLRPHAPAIATLLEDPS